MTEFPPPHVDFRTNILIGDAGGSMFDFSRGGNMVSDGDETTAVFNDMWSDGQLSGGAQGGKDLFVFKDNGSTNLI